MNCREQEAVCYSNGLYLTITVLNESLYELFDLFCSWSHVVDPAMIKEKTAT